MLPRFGTAVLMKSYPGFAAIRHTIRHYRLRAARHVRLVARLSIAVIALVLLLAISIITLSIDFARTLSQRALANCRAVSGATYDTFQRTWRRIRRLALLDITALTRRWIRRGVLGTIIGAVLVLAANAWVVGSTSRGIYDRAEAVPANDVGLVLGAYPGSWYSSLRVKTAAELYHAGRVRHLLVSGDNHRHDYDEPSEMKRSLIALGVPAESVTCDFAGLRTLDSLIRARRIFGQHRLTVISQGFHLHRALAIARHHGINAVGFAAPDPPQAQASRRVFAREWLARPWMLVDIYLLRRGPRHLGPYEPIQPTATNHP